MSKQRIMHGATIDTATPDEVARIVAKALDAQSTEDYTRRRGVVNLNAAGNGQDSIDISPQYDWLIRYYSYSGPGWVQSATVVELMENDPVSQGNILDVQAGGGPNGTGLSSGAYLYLPAGTQLFVVVLGGLGNSQLLYSFQIRQLHRRDSA